MIFADNVLETTTTVGTGDHILAGPPNGFDSFLSAFSVGDPVYYVVSDSAEGGVDWETVRGVLQDGPARLTRVEVLASSNGGAAVNWSAGSKRIWSGPPAAALRGMLTDHVGASEPAVKTRGVRWLDISATPHLQKQFDGTGWVIKGSLDPATQHFVPYRKGAALPGPGAAEGDFPVLQAGGLLDPARVPLLAAAIEITIASGVITPTGHYHSVDTEADAASDEISTISTTGIDEGGLLVLRAENAARVVTVKDGTGNLNLAAGDFALDDLGKRLLLQRRGAGWDELARSAQPQEAGLKAKAAVRFGGDGTLSVDGSFNVDSVTDLGTGYYRVNFTTAFPNTNYVIAGAVGDEFVVGGAGMLYTRARNIAWCEISTYLHSGAPFDARDVNIAFFEV